ncbi:hypothetical protein TNCV_4186221 [Trichonephila clavipes]|nr:hypothetical protein TNCV_4186221 [Trichonephila clavipes]
MDVFKCIVPSRRGVALNSRRATSPLERLEEKDESEMVSTSDTVVTDSWLACYELEPITTEYHPCCSVEVRKGGDSSGVILINGPWYKITGSFANNLLAAL